jgi:hypothetical protein
MSVIAMRISNFFIVLTLGLVTSACNKADEKPPKDGDKSTAQAEINDGKLECALAGAADFSRVCTNDRIAGSGGQMLIIHHPDGGFRRFNILTDGRGLESAEGAEQTKVLPISADLIEVSTGDDRYRLPAKMKAADVPATPTK